MTRRATSQDDYPAAVSSAIDAGRGKCPKCWGSGKVAGGTDDLDAWPAWEALPPGSDLAVRLGMVYPVDCPKCAGTGAFWDPTGARAAFTAIEAERRRQDAKWGEQNHPDGTGDQEHPLVDLAYYRSSELFERMTAGSLAYRAKDATDRAAREGRGTWAAILLEEVFEALAEDDPAALRTELIQVAAVATQWVERLDARLAEAREILGEQP